MPHIDERDELHEMREALSKVIVLANSHAQLFLTVASTLDTQSARITLVNRRIDIARETNWLKLCNAFMAGVWLASLAFIACLWWKGLLG